MTTSYWLHTAPGTRYPSLEQDLDIDVVVVGAGISGISTAWQLARRGHAVALVEADEVAASTSGHTTAKLTALHTLIYDRLRSTLGSETAQLYAAAQQDALARVAAASIELDLECELEVVRAVTYATEQGPVLEEIHREVEAASAAGLRASFADRTELPFPVAGAIEVAEQAQFHPRKYLLGLVQDFVERGGLVFEQTRVTGLHWARPYSLTTQNDRTIRARHVVIATQFPMLDRTLLFPRLVPHREWVVAGPIPKDADPLGMYITPENGSRSVRTAPLGEDTRLLIVTGAAAEPGAPGATERLDDLRRWTTSQFPQWQESYHWAAQDHTSSDRIPFVGRSGPMNRNLYVATGFGGWGMSNGVMAGHLIASLVDDEELPWTSVFDPARLHIRAEAAPFAKAGLSVVRHQITDRIQSPAKDPEDISPDDIPVGGGQVVRHGLQWLAVARDEDGALHTVSARCTHLGCLVGFNDEEKVWECPCHGSRFSLDGEVLQGPATSALARKETESATAYRAGVDDLEG